MSTNPSLSVLDMVNAYSEDSGVSEEDIFKKSEPKPEQPQPEVIQQIRSEPPSPGVWQPSAEALEGLDELSSQYTGVVYAKDEVAFDTGEKVLIDGMDEHVYEVALDTFTEMERCHYHIEKVKSKLGILKCDIPSAFHGRIMDAAGDIDTAKVEIDLTNVFEEIIRLVPECVIEWAPGYGPDMKPDEIVQESIIQKEASIVENIERPDLKITKEPEIKPSPNERPINPIVVETAPDLTLVIDKSQVSELSFTDEELEKIRKSRSIELKIIEEQELHYSVIGEPENSIDIVLSQYTRKFNDRAVSLPASKYRCTVTGLSFPEITDLSMSIDLNNLDGERKKWSIAYTHIKNPSIGNFVDFDDFLQKTSYLDLDFILWNILCATCMDKEIIGIDCGHPGCNNHYDWIYSPGALLQMDVIEPAVLEEMKITGTVSTTEDITSNYNQSFLRQGNIVELPSSKFVVCFGHISAYTYLESVFGRIDTLRTEQEDRPIMPTEMIQITTMTILKYFLLPTIDGSGNYHKVSNINDMMKIIATLDEYDYGTLDQLLTLVTNPYIFTYAMDGLVCPKCKNKSTIQIESIARLIFLLSQSLRSVNVVLKKQ